MAHDDTISHRIRETQVRIGRIAEKNGTSLKAISLDSGIPYNTVRSYFSQEHDAAIHIMPVTALVKLIGVIPDEWLSLLFDIGGRVLTVPNAADHDELAATCISFAGEHARARHPESEEGVAISANEDRALRSVAAKVRA